ncbi:MAG: YceI family protein [Chloroflexota bacterium]
MTQTPFTKPDAAALERGRAPRIRTILLALVVAALIGGMAVWYIFFSGPPAPRRSAPALVILRRQRPGRVLDRAGRHRRAHAQRWSGPRPAGGPLDGTWSVDPGLGSFDYDAGDFSGSWVGYRVQEQLVGVAGSTAVGRTPDVTGTTIEGTAVTGASFEANLATLSPTSPCATGSCGARASRPTATRPPRSCSPSRSSWAACPPTARDVAISAAGDLTIHGVTRPVTIELHAALHGDVIAAVGSLTFPWSGFPAWSGPRLPASCRSRTT